MNDYRELYIRGILELTEEYGLAYKREELEEMPEDELIKLRDYLRMKHTDIHFKRYC